ncbi:MAG: hypothetical protein HDQ96_05710 [Lachnospiraceae bacterium]|nr:hypothetical protein [Lachnospiraceae bacterium]
MSSKVIKIGSVIACIIVILVCSAYYTGHISTAVYNIRSRYPAMEVEDCSARITDTTPEGYYVNYYGDVEDFSEMEVVEVTLLLSNHTNNTASIRDFWTYYNDAEGYHLYEMEEDTENLAVSNYENRKIIPPGEQASLKEYVLVPRGMHEIMVKTDNMESFTITF